MGPPVVRGLPPVRLLLPVARLARRGTLGCISLRGRLQAHDGHRRGNTSRLGLGLRETGRLQEAYSGADGRGDPAVLVQHVLHDRRRKPHLDARRRILVLTRLYLRIALSRRVRVRAPHGPAAVVGGRPSRNYAPVPRYSGPRFRGRRNRARTEPMGQELVAGPRPGRSGRCLASGVLAGPVRGRSSLQLFDGLYESHRSMVEHLSGPSLLDVHPLWARRIHRTDPT